MPSGHFEKDKNLGGVTLTLKDRQSRHRQRDIDTEGQTIQRHRQRDIDTEGQTIPEHFWTSTIAGRKIEYYAHPQPEGVRGVRMTPPPR